MVDAKHPDLAGAIVAVTDDLVGTATCRPEPGEPPLKRVAQPAGRLGQWSYHQLDYGGSDGLR